MFGTGQRITPFFTFKGEAEAAMNFYVSVFPDSAVLSITRIGKEDRGIEGKVLNGTFQLMGQPFMVMDIEPEYSTAFSWAVSMLIECASEAEFDSIFASLSAGGLVMMGPEPVLNLRKVAWVTDRYGVTWQLVWE